MLEQDFGLSRPNEETMTYELFIQFLWNRLGDNVKKRLGN